MSILSGRRARFVELYLGEAQGDPAKAAALAGFDVPNRQGLLLLRSAEVRAAIEAGVAKPIEPAPVEASPPPVELSAASSQRTVEPPRTAEQNEACDVLVLRAIHDVTEHYRAHRPKLFEGFEGYTPGATHKALLRYSPLRPAPSGAALKRLRAHRLVHVVSYTGSPVGGDPERYPPGRSIYQLTEQGLGLLRSLDDARFTHAIEVASALLKAPEQRRPLPKPE